VIIERIQVEDGFLDGLDIRFSSGLNVLIGARGTGKTSVIELIRFGLLAGSFTEEAGIRGKQQALAVLGGGRVTVTVQDLGERRVLERSAADADWMQNGPSSVTVIAQNEIEAVGSQPVGRLRLIDRFSDLGDFEVRAAPAIARLKSETTEIHGLLLDLDRIESQLENLTGVSDALADALTEQDGMLRSIAATEDDRSQLEALQGSLTRSAMQLEILERTRTLLDGYLTAALRLSQTGLSPDDWPEAAGPDLLAPVRQRLASVSEALQQVIQQLLSADHDVASLITSHAAERHEIESDARGLRSTLNALSEGAGAITRRVDGLREQLGQSRALQEASAQLRRRLLDLTEARGHSYAALDVLRDEVFSARRTAASKLSAVLRPNIRIELTRAGNVEEFANRIASALKGSGLHYNRLATQLAEAMSPLELVMATEHLDVDVVSNAIEVPYERAAAIVRHLRAGATADLIASNIEDAASLYLLDGAEEKPTERLSIGQRCTVVLPILLSGQDKALLVDQPEDHLDNAFVVDTLVERLRKRVSGTQLILASHNPNIPVLGEADLVAALKSDGRRGFVSQCGALDDAATVDAISSIMEGGADAFRRRAEFYQRAKGAHDGP
jgi:hypothetical protein